MTVRLNNRAVIDLWQITINDEQAIYYNKIDTHIKILYSNFEHQINLTDSAIFCFL